MLKSEWGTKRKRWGDKGMGRWGVGRQKTKIGRWDEREIGRKTNAKCGVRPEPRGVQGCHAPYVVHGGVRSKIVL
jgi:hypothetical protein